MVGAPLPSGLANHDCRPPLYVTARLGVKGREGFWNTIMEPICKSCRFYRKDYQQWDSVYFDEVGFCRKYNPPWPHTRWDDYCGEFEPLFEPPEPECVAPRMNSFDIPPLGGPTRKSRGWRLYSWIIGISLAGILIWICVRAFGCWWVGAVIIAIVVAIYILCQMLKGI